MVARRVALLLVAAMVLVAGCTGNDVPPQAKPVGANATTTATAGTTNATASSPTETTTPSETTTTATTTASRNATLPPGLNATGVENPSALVAAHRNALDNASFAFWFGANVSVGPANQWTIQRGSVAPGLSPLVVHSRSIRNVDGETTSVATDLWANDSTVVVRYHRKNRTELRWYNRTSKNTGAYDETWAHLPRADLPSQVTQSWLVELALAVGEYDLVRTERRDGRNVTILRATEPVAAANVTDLNATLVVDETGRVRSLSLTVKYAGDNRTRIHYGFELTEVGNVSVSRPSWVGAAIPPNGTAGNTTTTTLRDHGSGNTTVTTTTRTN